MMNVDNVISKVANLLSAIFSPLFVPAYAMAIIFHTSYLVANPPGVRWVIVGIVLLITGLMPLGALVLMKRMGLISDIDVSDRTERTIPIILMGVCYAACAFFLQRVHAPSVLVNMMWGGLIGVVVQLIVNRWWKISAHGAGMGALVAMLVVESRCMPMVTSVMPFIIAAVLLSGVIGTCRLLLQKHTLMQVLIGFVNGFVCVYFFAN